MIVHFKSWKGMNKTRVYGKLQQTFSKLGGLNFVNRNKVRNLEFLFLLIANSSDSWIDNEDQRIGFPIILAR